MKRIVVSVLITLLAGCSPLVDQNQDTDSADFYTEVFADFFGSSGSSVGAKSAPPPTYNDGDTITLKAYDASRQQKLINTDGINYETTLTYSGGVWSGTIDLRTIRGLITFVAVAKHSNNQVFYTGKREITLTIDNYRTRIELTGSETFSLGEMGPGGGYIFYNSGNYASDGFKYLEAAPSDLSLAWTDAFIDTSLYTVPTTGENAGNVIKTVGSEVVLTKYDFYWGPAGSPATYTYSTSAALGKGYDNTHVKLDAVSTVTPKFKKSKGRKAIPEADATNTRRDTPTVLQTTPYINGMNDWFIPSKLELDALYTNRTNVSGLASTTYWSSTEDLADPYVSTVYIDDNNTSSGTTSVPNGYARDFSAGSGAEIARSTNARVRPTRMF